MGHVIVDVMPKPEILDPQGKAIEGALAKMRALPDKGGKTVIIKKK